MKKWILNTFFKKEMEQIKYRYLKQMLSECVYKGEMTAEEVGVRLRNKVRDAIFRYEES